MQDRYLFQHSITFPDGYILTDRENGIVCRFIAGDYNETQEFTILEDIEHPDVLTLARATREMGDWLGFYHPELI